MNFQSKVTITYQHHTL